MPVDSQVDGAAVRDGMVGDDLVGRPDGLDGHDGVAGPWVSATRVAELEATIAQLREAMVSRQQLGVVTGILAAKLEVTPDEAWAVFKATDPKLDDTLNRQAWIDTLPRLAASPAAVDDRRYERFGAFMKEKGLINTVEPVGRYVAGR